MWPNFILREFAEVRTMKILGRKNEIAIPSGKRMNTADQS